jgi:hypothetical protein
MCSCTAYDQECIVHIQTPIMHWSLTHYALGLDSFRNRPAKLSPTLSMSELSSGLCVYIFSAYAPVFLSSGIPIAETALQASCMYTCVSKTPAPSA